MGGESTYTLGGGGKDLRKNTKGFYSSLTVLLLFSRRRMLPAWFSADIRKIARYERSSYHTTNQPGATLPSFLTVLFAVLYSFLLFSHRIDRFLARVIVFNHKIALQNSTGQGHINRCHIRRLLRFTTKTRPKTVLSGEKTVKNCKGQ